MNTDRVTGILERIIYGLLLGVAMKFVAWGWLDAEMAPYIAAGGVGFVGAAWAWWINRPSALMTAAGNQLPENSKLVIQSTPAASSVERQEARDLANASSAKVTAKTS